MSEHPAIPRLVRSTALLYFSEVAARGSFRAAADALHIAASAINRQISNLEADLGAKLFERARGRAGLQLTEAGRILQSRLRSAINELRIANAEIVALQGLQRGHVTIGLNDAVVKTVLPEAIKKFHQTHPNITFRVKVDTTRELESLLMNGDIDFAVGYNFPSTEDFVLMETVPLKMHLIASAEHPLATRSSVVLADLAGFNLILPDRSGFPRHMFDFAFRGSSVRINPIVETNSSELIHSLVECGMGISIVTGREQREGNGRLVHIEIDDPLLSPNVLACCKSSGRSLSLAAEAFASAVCDALRTFGNTESRAGGSREEEQSTNPGAAGVTIAING